MSDLGDVVSASGGIFPSIEKNYSTGIDTTVLDMLLIERYGTKEISPFFSKFVEDGKVTREKMDTIASAIVAKFSDYWDSVKLVNGVKVDFTKPHDMTRTKSNNLKREGTTTDERTENQKLVSYDSSDFTDTGRNDSTGNGKSSSDETGNETETTTGHEQQISIASMIQYVDMHNRTNIVSAYIDAVGSVLALPIWSNE